MDTDVSHEVEKRLAGIEARLDKLDGGPTAQKSEQEETFQEQEVDETEDEDVA